MDSLFPNQPVIDFGPNHLHEFQPRPTAQQIKGSKPSVLRSFVKQLCPRKPGIYGMFNAHGYLIYIGKAKSLRTRLLGYFRSKSRDPKAGRIIRNTTRLAWEICPNEFAALHRELELIRRWRPRYNVIGQPHVQRPIYVCLGRAPAPYVFLSRKPPKDVMATYGPISSNWRAGEAVRRLNDLFQLRDCAQTQTMHFREQGELFPLELTPGCLRYDIGTCTAPCAGTCSRSEYFDQVQSVQNFLEGKNDQPLRQLASEVDQAARAYQFERAAVLRDRLEVLTWLSEQLHHTHKLRKRGNMIYPLTGNDGKTIWYFIHMGQTVRAIPKPTDDTTRKEALRLIHAIYRKDFVTSGEQLLARRDSILIVAHWFRHYPRERDQTLTPEKAIKHLQSVAETNAEVIA